MFPPHTGENVEMILKLAHEYNIKKLLEECDRHMYEQLGSSSRDEDFMKYLMLAQRYRLSDVKGIAIEHLSRQTKNELERLDDSMGVSSSTMAEIFKKRLELFESGSLVPRNTKLPVSDVIMVKTLWPAWTKWLSLCKPQHKRNFLWRWFIYLLGWCLDAVQVAATTTVYPKKYAHGFVVLCFVVVMQSFIMNSHEVFIHFHQGCFAGTGAIVRLPQCQWSKPDGYGKISQCITKQNTATQKPCAYFLGYTVLMTQFTEAWVN